MSCTTQTSTKIPQPIGIGIKDLTNDAALSIIFKHIIIRSDKPTNTAFTLISISKQWCEISKGLFDRDTDVWTAFGEQIQEAASTYENIFFIVWMMRFLRDKDPECKIFDEQYFKNIQEMQSKVILECSANNKIIIGNSFQNRILPVDLISFFVEACSIPSIKEPCFYQVLFFMIKNTQVVNSFILIKKIEQCINGCIENVLYRNSSVNQLLRLIEGLGDYVITENTLEGLKIVYVRLIMQFFHVFYLETEVEQCLKNEQFLNIAVKFFQLLPREETVTSLDPLDIFNLIFKLKHSEEKYKLVEYNINEIKKLNYFALNNILKIKNNDIKNYLLMDELIVNNIDFNLNHLRKFLVNLDKNPKIFLDNIQGYLRLIECIFVKIKKDSEETATEALDWIDYCFNSIKEFLEKNLASGREKRITEYSQLEKDTYDAMIDGYLEYFKSM